MHLMSPSRVAVCVWVGVLLILTPTPGWTLSSRSKVTLDNNGYKNILVAIHEAVPEDQTIIDEIKKMFVDGSAYLYKATYKRAFFEQVTILLPTSWTSVTAANGQAVSQRYEDADIEVASATPTVRSGSTPYTRSYGGCGQPGIRIHLTPEFFTGGTSVIRQFGPRGRLLVHEWGHFRWGVFDEYAQEGEAQFYFSPSTGNLEVVRCNVNMKGQIYDGKIFKEQHQVVFCRAPDPATGRYPDTCTFRPDPRLSNGVITASIMDRQELPPIIYFCDDDQSDQTKVHNSESSSQQNRLCGQRSTWAVISESEDFRQGRNSPRDVSSTDPTFVIVKAPPTRRVALLLDTSNSVTEDRLQRLRQSAASFLQDGVRQGDQVGVVQFASRAQVLAPLTTVQQDQDRRRLKDALPQNSGGDTSLGAGLFVAAQMLNLDGGNGTTSEIVLVSDGKETAAPFVADVLPALQEAGIIVSSIALSDSSDDVMADLAEATGGRYYFDGHGDAPTGLLDGFLHLAVHTRHLPDQDVVQLVSKAWTLAPGEETLGHFAVDDAVGRDTKVTFTYSAKEPVLTLTSPTGRLYSKTYPEYHAEPNLKLVHVVIPEIAESGTWTYHVTNGPEGYQNVGLSALSRPVDPERNAIRVSASLSNSTVIWPASLIIYAEVKAGSCPVTGLNVKAVVDRPFADPVEVDLYDSGAGADVRKGDGVYSRYFTQFSGPGRYSVRVEVLGEAGAACIALDSHVGVHADRAFASLDPTQNVKQPMTSPITRATTAGSFRLMESSPGEVRSGRASFLSGDVLAPVRIIDLKVMRTSQADQSVVLAWTAPGGDLDHDTASYYQISLAHNANDLLNQHRTARNLDASELLRGDLTSPKAAGRLEMIVVKMPHGPKQNASYVFTVRAVDQAGNAGDYSNYVSAGFGFVPDYVDPDFHALDLFATPPPQTPPHSQVPVIAGILGTALGLIVIAIAASIVLLLITRKAKVVDVPMKKLSRKKITVPSISIKVPD